MLALSALTAAGASAEQARPLAAAVAAAEADGIASHGLAYVPTYCEHLRCGKVDGKAVPVVTKTKPALLVGRCEKRICASRHRCRLRHNSSRLRARWAWPQWRCAIPTIAACSAITPSGWRAAGLLGMGFTNAPASIAPFGGRKAVIGTNPFAIAAPDGQGGAAISIDQSASVIAKSEVMRRKRAARRSPKAGPSVPTASRPPIRTSR